MSQNPTSDVIPRSSAARGQRYEVAGHGASSPRTVAMFHSAQNLQIEGSSFSVAGRDVIHNHSHNIHYHNERPRDVWGILQLIHNFRKIYQDMISKATEGTGMWLVEGDKFRVWLEPNGDIKIFWGSGIPGAGKTLLASIVIEYLEALYPEPGAKISICYIYFRYSDHSEVTVRAMLEALVRQTLERHPECQALIEQTYARHLREGTEPTEAQLLALLRGLANGMSCTFYILDALDEAPTRIQFAMLKALTSLNVKLFITSRPLKPLEAHFPQAHTFTITAQDTDLDLHITKGINEDVELQRLLKANPSLRDEIFSTIKQSCGGMFLHASLWLDALHECISADQVRRRLKDFPSTIEDVYHQTWNRILMQSADLVSVAKAALVWVLNASRPMTVEELEQAVATSPDTHNFEPDRLVPGTTLMSLCRGLISVEEESRIVRLVHYTAKETLDKLLRESFPRPHSLLAAICMATLTECGFQNTRISSEEEFRTALEKNTLLPYATEAWAFHAGKSLDVDGSKHRTAQFISEIKAFPAYTSYDRTRHFDILTPLHTASLYHLPLAVITDAIEGNLNVTTAVRLQSPLIIASQSGNEALVAHLIALSTIEVNLVDTRERSALIWAAMQGHEGIVTILLAHPEIQVSMVDNDGRLALMWAVINGHISVVKLLLTHPEVLVNLPGNDGWSALMQAAYRGHEGVVKLLLAHPEIRVNLVSNYGWSALMRAAHWGQKGIVKLLLAHPEVKVNLVSKKGSFALIMAAYRDHQGVVELLLAHSEIQVNLVDNDGYSVLILAASKGHEGIVKLLLAHPEIQVNLADNDGYSALMVAARNGHAGVVNLLLARPEIQVDPATNHGSTALVLAAEYGHDAIVELLRDFESLKGATASLPKISQLSLHNEDGSDSETEEAYYDAEEEVDEEDVGLIFLISG